MVFLAFATSQVSFIKLFGIGLALAVLMDAFVIRGTLVPAFMRLAGERQLVGAPLDAPAPRPHRLQRDRRPRREAPPAADGDGRARGPGTGRGRMTPVARPRSRRGEGERLRDEILAAADELLVETASEDAVSIRAVADAVGVTPPSIYRHFPDKTSLLVAVCLRSFDSFAEVMREARDPDDPLAEPAGRWPGPTCATGSSTPSTTGSCSWTGSSSRPSSTPRS